MELGTKAVGEFQVAGVPPLWGALAALARLIGKPAAKKVIQKMNEMGIKDPKKQTNIIKKQIEKNIKHAPGRPKVSAEDYIKAGEFALNEYLHYTKKQEKEGAPRDKLSHVTDRDFGGGSLDYGEDNLAHLAEEPISDADDGVAGRSVKYYESPVDINDMREVSDSGNWGPEEFAEELVRRGLIKKKDFNRVMKIEDDYDREDAMSSLLGDAGIDFLRYKNTAEGSWKNADRDVRDTYSVLTTDPYGLKPRAEFTKFGYHEGGGIKSFDLGRFVEEGERNPSWWRDVDGSE